MGPSEHRHTHSVCYMLVFRRKTKPCGTAEQECTGEFVDMPSFQKKNKLWDCNAGVHRSDLMTVSGVSYFPYFVKAVLNRSMAHREAVGAAHGY